MAKRQHKQRFQTEMCTCTKCGVSSLSVKETKHRRCSGKPPKTTEDGEKQVFPIRPKYDPIPFKERGIWE